MKFDKSSCLQRAKEMLKSRNDSLLRYVCLELRFCMEAITYGKLKTYSKRLPADVLAKWQPPQAVKALLEFEPDADQSFELRISPESSPGVPTGEWFSLGSHKSLKLGWLRKHYNKLGNLLHVIAPGAKASALQSDPQELRKYLETVAAELEPVAASRMDSSLATVVDFQCSVCGDTVIANLAGVQKTRRAVCLNPSCGAEFAAVETEDGELGFLLMASHFECIKCGHETTLQNKKLEIGYKFKCERCGEEHQLMKRQWAYALVSELASNPEAAPDG